MRQLLLALALVAAVAATPTIMTLPYRSNLRVYPFSTLPQPDFYWIDGATVTIDVGYNAGFDHLYFDYEGQFPITASFNENTGVLSMTGTASSSEYVVAIASVVFFTTASDGARRQITYSLGADTFYLPLTEHYYRFFDAAGTTWSSAADRCAASSFFNMTGYLATITSQDEQDGIGAVATFNTWLGGNDIANYGEYQWAVGPEAGTAIWSGQSMYAGGTAPENVFTAWNRFQPENPSGSGQDYMYLVNSADQATTYWAVGGQQQLVQGYLCEYGSPKETTTVQVAGGAIELTFSCALFAAADDCQSENLHGCQWSVSTNQCVQSTCSKFNSETFCVGSTGCYWDDSGEIGVCLATQCASLSPANCPLNPQCMVAQGGVACRPAYCSERSTACSCNQQDGCLWRDGVCANTQSVDCSGMDVVFVVDSSAELANPYGRHPQGYFGLLQSLATTDFFLNGNPAGTRYPGKFTGQRVGIVTFGGMIVGVGSATNGRLTSNRAEWASDIQSLQQSYTATATGRTIRDALTTAQGMYDAASNRTRLIVVLAAGGIIDASFLDQQQAQFGMNSLLGSLQSIGVNIIGAAISSASTDTISSLNAIASLKLLTDGTPTTVKNATISELASRLYYGMCWGTSLSQYLRPGKTSLQCTVIPDAKTCGQDPRCAWDSAAGQCSNNACPSACSASTCASNPACTWDTSSSMCSALCPKLGKDACLGAPAACLWDYPAAACRYAPCVTNPNEDACIADSTGCTWDPSLPTPCHVTPCLTTNATACGMEFGCIFNGVECMVDACHTMSDPNKCGSLPQCEWNQDVSLCQRNLCGLHVTERQCAADFSCVWNMSMSPAACGPRMCTSFNLAPATAQVMCQLNQGQCFWQTSGQAPRCVERVCELMATSCDCNKVSGCLWRNQTCQRDTFAQCPPTDIVFLVEASPVMDSAFGRHPNGYIGIVEAIRSWSANAPFAWAVDAPGFRFALVEYGQNLPLFVPSSVGGGGNLTSSSVQWIGAGQELDWNEQNERAYATSGQSGTVALRPALAQAINIFSASDAMNRKKLVVILGNSPITDGGSAMLRQINALEVLGVKIFANVIRRFSYVTPLDTLAEMFMRPIASDPPSTFFSFATIDTMQESLLAAFCDPSSSTGKYLEVSRNGELPCEWLSGADQCGVQGSCAWDPKGLKVCPLAGQCPTLNCQPLPVTLANLYDCNQCQLVSGAISCSRSKPPPIQRGLCGASACATTCQNSCTSATCEWLPTTMNCERHVCTAFSDMANCNLQPGCVWDETGSSPTCQRSACGRLRDSASCGAPTSSTPEGFTYTTCFYNKALTPAVCMAYRCPMLSRSTCVSSSMAETCAYDVAHSFCSNLQCQYPMAELCDLDAACYWDWYNSKCKQRSASCALAPYSDWSPCSATCGSAFTYKSRAILQFPSGGLTCPQMALQGCTEATVCAPTDINMTIIQTCTEPPALTNGKWIPENPSVPKGEWPTDCSLHCQSLKLRFDCMRDSSCEWDGKQCQVTSFPGCHAFWTATECASSDMCQWDDQYGVCQPSMQICPYQTPAECKAVSYCSWRAGSSVQVMANAMQVPLQMVNPGQVPIFPFDTLASTDTTPVNGATITVETNYQRGKDRLAATFNNRTTSQWIEAEGTLLIYGNATVAEYLKVIRFVTFSTTSTRTVPRTITWSLGANTAYSTITGNHYRVVTNAGATYGFAEADCSRRYFFGLQGYLSTVTSQSENDLISSKLFGEGWISGSDASGQTWQMTSGPEATSNYAFWYGPSFNLGGHSVDGHYSNWSPPNSSNLYGEPIINTGISNSGNDRVYLAQSGYWESRSFDSEKTAGYVCEFGGLASDLVPAFPTGGSMMIGVGGCIAQDCIWHNSEAMCTADIACMWKNGVCQLGCGALGTQADCGGNPLCHWDTTILPPVCDVDPCAPLAQNDCVANTQCRWSVSSEKCKLQTGCGIYGTMTACQNNAACYWASSCMDRGCGSFTTPTTCRNVPKCRWDETNAVCADQFCMYATEALCDTDAKHCEWNMPSDSRTATFNAATGAMYPFQANVDPCNDVSTQVDGITVAITAGLQPNADVLSIDPSLSSSNNYAVTYDGVTGIMKITVNPGTFVACSDAFKFLADAVMFSTTSASKITRTMTYVLSANAAYSVSTQTYYKWMAATPSSFSDAQGTCASTSMFGMSGRVATIMNEGDGQLVSQLGTPGWIAASSDANGLWSWIMPGGMMTPFWNGTGVLGVPISTSTNGTGGQYMFSEWGLGEPSQPSSFGYVATDGSWKAVIPGSSATGVICAFGSAMQLPTATIAGFRRAAPGGCFASLCKSLGASQCYQNGQCTVVNGMCQSDNRCSMGQSISQCNSLALCYWDYSQQACLGQQPDQCSKNTHDQCLNSTMACRWAPELILSGQSTSGFCVSRGCARHPASSPCKADPMCTWNSVISACTARLCGWTTADQCWTDPLCVFSNTPAFTGCTRSPCAGFPQTTCAALPTCKWSALSATCTYARCGSKDMTTCLQDQACIFVSGVCSMPACNWTMTQSACNGVSNCYYSVVKKTCSAARCVSFLSQGTCEQGQSVTNLKPCIWDNNKCRQPTPSEQLGSASEDSCQNETNGNMWWLWVFLAIILVLLGMILHRLFLAYAGQGSIFEPTKRNYKYNPHERYAASIVDTAAARAGDDNVQL